MEPLEWVGVINSSILLVYAVLFFISRVYSTSSKPRHSQSWSTLVKALFVLQCLVVLSLLGEGSILATQMSTSQAWSPVGLFQVATLLAAWGLCFWSATNELNKFNRLHWTCYGFWLLAALAETCIDWANVMQFNTQDDASFRVAFYCLWMSRLVTVWCVLILSWVHLCQQRHAMSSVPNSGPSETTPLLSHLENTSSMDSPGAWPDLEAHTSPVHPHQQPPNTALPVLSSDITQEPEALASSPSSPLPTDATVVDMPTNETAVDDTIASSDLPQTIASTDHVDPTDNHPSTPTSSSGPDTAVKPAKSKSGKRGSKTKSKKKPKRKSTSFM